MDANQIRNKYTGETVDNYDAKRKQSDKWINEQHAVELLINKAASDSDIHKLLDIPVGTGRFFDLYTRFNLEVVGADVSDDMISKSREKVNKEFRFVNISIQYGDLLKCSNIDMKPDIVVCIRLLNWFSFDEVREVMNNIVELNAEYAIIGIRTQSDQEAGFKKNLWLLQAQIISRLLNPTAQNKYSVNIHPENEFKQILQRHFNIKHKVLVNVGTSTKNFESKYYIYLLQITN